MDKKSIEKILRFIESEQIGDYDINFDYEIEDDVLIAKFSGHFTNNNDIEMEFVYEDNQVQFYHLGECFIEADTRSFWIDFMSRICR